MSGSTADRQRILRSLLEADQPLERVLRDLAEVPWDGDEELVTLRPAQVIETLNRFRTHRLDANEVETWANAIEGREDIGLDEGSQELLKEAIFELANPELQGALTDKTAQRWIERLSFEQDDTITLHQHVRVVRDVPEQGVSKGMSGAVIAVLKLPHRAYEVEVIDAERTVHQATLVDDDLEVVKSEP